MGRKAKEQNQAKKAQRGSHPGGSIITDKRSATLCHEDALAGSPDEAIMGEEDAGVGIEFLIRESEERWILEKRRGLEKQP